MAKIKTNELIGTALDWAVAYAEGRKFSTMQSSIGLKPFVVLYDDPLGMFTPSTSWAHGGPILEREGISIYRMTSDWSAAYNLSGAAQDGPTPLIAVMRCYVSSCLGSEVEVPEELACSPTPKND